MNEQIKAKNPPFFQKRHLWWQIPVVLFGVLVAASYANKLYYGPEGRPKTYEEQVYITAHVCLNRLKKVARNPDSVEMIDFGTNNAGDVVIRFRGQNGFGGMSIETRNCGKPQ